MAPDEAIKQLKFMLPQIEKLKIEHPNYRIKFHTTWNQFKAGWCDIPEGSGPVSRVLTIDEALANIWQLIQSLEELKITHPAADVCPRTRKKLLDYGAILSVRTTGWDTISNVSPGE